MKKSNKTPTDLMKANTKAFKKLIKTYRKLAKPDNNEIEKEIGNYFFLDVVDGLRAITGFGNTNSCSLCKACDCNCKYCVYMLKTNYNCNYGINEETYDNIINSYTINQLKKALIIRANYMEGILNETI